jgi:hypothetical protein
MAGGPVRVRADSWQRLVADVAGDVTASSGLTGSGDTVAAVMSRPAFGVTSSSRERLSSVALIVSSLAVVAVAATFDVLAGERPDHTLSLVLVAGAVGVVRWFLRGRLRGLFSLINLAVVAQPVAHGVGELTQSTAGLMPHSHVVPEELAGLAVQLAVAALVAVVAGSEPIAVFVASTVLTVATTLARGRVPEAVAPVVRPARPENDTIPTRADEAVHCRPHRGPPALVGLTV